MLDSRSWLILLPHSLSHCHFPDIRMVAEEPLRDNADRQDKRHNRLCRYETTFKSEQLIWRLPHSYPHLLPHIQPPQRRVSSHPTHREIAENVVFTDIACRAWNLFDPNDLKSQSLTFQVQLRESLSGLLDTCSDRNRTIDGTISFECLMETAEWFVRHISGSSVFALSSGGQREEWLS
ncbi:hypothetical protein BLNAU_11131 [Blattamonas nauphoetae]|uniref:Uncharacterized protein n=1 Tax=Blattamonas nauphoetae TaxID=2049346 RepID=A0ABQ9XN73_9EUKA|nr:hypothetical protein BLNAU_11131 [Blattamonas nauphoetae]